MFWEQLAFLEKKQWERVNKTIAYNYQNSNSELILSFNYFYSKVLPIIGGFSLCANVW